MKKFTFISIALSAMIALQLNAQVSFNIKVYLEGPFYGTEMTTALNSEGLIPLTQPYNVSPWNYPGTEQVSLIPNADVVDWLLIELRETTGDASTATPDKMIHRQAAFLKKGGEVVALDGTSLITYSGSITSNLYLIIWHRNHLAMMSSGALTNIGGIYSWDFTGQLSKAYLDGQKEIGTGQYGMIGGDCDANDTVQMADHEPMWEDNAGRQSYSAIDLNLDSQINNPDKDDVWFPNIGAFARIPSNIPFTCGGLLVDDRDGQAYNTIQIGTQCWMAENLNVGAMLLASYAMTDNAIIEKYCNNNSTDSCAVYGGLYQWDELMQYTTQQGSQGICPAGWHVPSDAEWCTVTQYIDPTVDCEGGTGWSGTDVGIKMKSSSGWIEGGNGTNSSGFNALPGGSSYNDGSFLTPGEEADFWSSTEFSTGDVWYRWLTFSSDLIGLSSSGGKSNGFSLRCVKDQPVWGCGEPLIDSRDLQTYNTVQIGTQCWMAESMNIGTIYRS